MTVRDVWEKYQEGKSSQQNFIPQKEVLELIKEANIQASDSVLVVANIEVYTTLLDQKSHGLVNFSSIKFATDIESLKGREEVLVVDFADFDLEEVGRGFDKVLGRAPYLGREGDLLGEGTFIEKMEKLFGKNLHSFPLQITNVKTYVKFWQGFLFDYKGHELVLTPKGLCSWSYNRDSTPQELHQLYSMCYRRLKYPEGITFGVANVYTSIRSTMKLGRKITMHTSSKDLIINLDIFAQINQDIKNKKYLPEDQLVEVQYTGKQERSKEHHELTQEQLTIGARLKDYLHLGNLGYKESIGGLSGTDLHLQVKVNDCDLQIGIRKSGKSIWILATGKNSHVNEALQNKEKYCTTTEGIRLGIRPRQRHPRTVEEAIEVLEEFRKDLS